MAPLLPTFRTLFLLLVAFIATTTTCHAQTTNNNWEEQYAPLLSPEEFYTMATTGQVDLMIDIRDRSLWRNVGHIPNATHVNNFGRLLASTPTQDINATLRALGIFKCLKSSCVTVVYCRSAQVANATLGLLRKKAGFLTSNLYNGGGTTQWAEAGYKLVKTASNVNRPCMKVTGGAGAASAACLAQRNNNNNNNNNNRPNNNNNRPNNNNNNNNNNNREDNNEVFEIMSALEEPPSPKPSPKPTPAPVSRRPTPTPTPQEPSEAQQQQSQQQQQQQKDANPVSNAKCASVAGDAGRGGTAQASKDCPGNRQLRQREQEGRIIKGRNHKQ